MLLKGHLTDSALLKISKLFLVRTGSNQVWLSSQTVCVCLCVFTQG